MRKGFTDIIIDIPERFIGRYKNHRISIADWNEDTMFTITVTDPNNIMIVDEYIQLDNMADAIDYAITKSELS